MTHGKVEIEYPEWSAGQRGYSLHLRERTKQYANTKTACRPKKPGLDSTVLPNFAPFYFKELSSFQLAEDLFTYFGF